MQHLVIKAWEGCMWHVSLLQVYCWKQVQTAYSFSRSSRYLFRSGYIHIYLPKCNCRLVAGANILIYSLKGGGKKWERVWAGTHSSFCSFFLCCDPSQVSAWREKVTDQNTSDVDPHTITKCDVASLPPAAKPCWGSVCSFCGLNQLLFAKLSP